MGSQERPVHPSSRGTCWQVLLRTEAGNEEEISIASPATRSTHPNRLWDWQRETLADLLGKEVGNLRMTRNGFNVSGGSVLPQGM